MLDFRFCPRLHDFPDRKLAWIEPVTAKDLPPRLRGSAGRSISGAKEWQPENDARWWALALIRMGTISANARLIDPRRNATQDELF